MNLARVVPLTSFEFFYYDMIMACFNKVFPDSDYQLKSLTAGCFGGSLAYTTVYPIDFSRTMIAIDGVPKNISFF